jgi:hypothetical protein
MAAAVLTLVWQGLWQVHSRSMHAPKHHCWLLLV